MRIVKLSDALSVSEQILTQEVATIASAGFKVLVNNRPDGEVAGQPSSEEIAEAAQAAGMAYYHYPVTAMDFPGSHLEEMRELFNNAEQPVLAFCRSGTRCTNLWVASRDPSELAAAVDQARSLGYDLGLAARC